MASYALKRGPWNREGGPCPECGSTRCRSLQSFACWTRCFQRALQEHSYMRTMPHTRMLQEADIELLSAPQPGGYEVLYGPAWTLTLIDQVRQEAKDHNVSVPKARLVELLASSPRRWPPPSTLLARLDELRAFAVLRGWRFENDVWHIS